MCIHVYTYVYTRLAYVSHRINYMSQHIPVYIHTSSATCSISRTTLLRPLIPGPRTRAAGRVLQAPLAQWPPAACADGDTACVTVTTEMFDQA